MGKKSKQKQHRKAQNQAKQGTTQPIAQAQTGNPQFTLTITPPTNASINTPQPAQQAAGKVQPQNVLTMTDEYIRKDILRILCTLGVLVVFLITAVIINDRSTAFATAGEHLASFLRL